MDFGRYGCKRPCRFHTGEGAPVGEVLWYATKLTKCVEETCIVRREWDRDPWIDYPVGELPHIGKWRDFSNDGWPKAGLTGHHQCHPEWFATGEPWPTDLPDTIYNPNGIPTCCGLFQEPPAGGVVFGGAAGDALRVPDPTAGGVVFGGAAGDRIVTTDATAGGVVFGGAAGDTTDTIDPAAGGVEFGGAAEELVDTTDATAGGARHGGSAGDQYTAPPTFRAKNTTTDARTVANLPASIVPGEKLFVLLTVSTAGALPAAPTGWTIAHSENTTTPQFAIYQRTADGTEGATVSWGSTGGRAVATSYAITNGTAFGAFHMTGVLIGRALNYTNNSLTPAGAGAVIIQLCTAEDATLTAVNTDTIDASLTATGLLNDSAGAGNHVYQDTGHQDWASGAATGTRTSTSNSSPTVTGRGFMFLVD